MITVLPYRGEFGLKIRYHVPTVHALGFGYRVLIEEGEEALYPRAAEWVTVDRRDDDQRRGWSGDELVDELRERYTRDVEVVDATRPGAPETRFVPEPFEPQGVKADIVICPRKREYGAGKNWPFWKDLEYLPGVFAAGAPDSSQDDLECPKAWDYVRFLDATIEAMRSAKLVIATDAGLAHLAVLCGAPLLLITHGGLVAPGPQLDPDGNAMEPTYWPVRIAERYHAANHKGSPIYTEDSWLFRKLVRRRIDELVNSGDGRSGGVLDQPARGTG